jgi:hypothetical protein
MEVGGPYGTRYVVKPKTLDIVQDRSEHLYVTGLHWSKWTGGYGKHGLIRGSARGTGFVHATGARSRAASLYLSDVQNGGVNAFTYYLKMNIYRDPAVFSQWTWHMRLGKWQHSR